MSVNDTRLLLFFVSYGDIEMDFIIDQEIISGYTTDASNTTGFADALLRPKNTEELSQIVNMANQYQIPITITAKRTSTTGAPVPQGGWLISMEHFCRIHSLHEVDSGVILGEYQKFTEARGKMFPPDPTSRNECSIGGAIACNASGARSFRYGPIRPWVDALEVVFPNGEIQIINRQTPIPNELGGLNWSIPKVKTAAGYHPADNLLDLMIGQEGTLCIITRCWLRLIDVPQNILGMIVYFPSLEDCIVFVETSREGAKRYLQNNDDMKTQGVSSPYNPRALEFFDHQSIELIRKQVTDIPDCAQCGIFLEIEYDTDPNLESWFELFDQSNALVDDIIVAEDDESREQLYTIRHAIPAGVNEIVISNGMPKVGTDFSVPDHALRDMMKIYQNVSMQNILFGHIGDNHLHMNLFPKNSNELQQAKELYRNMALQAVDLGGSVSAEHGIGKLKAQLLSDMMGEEVMQKYKIIKAYFDPNAILGRGTLL